MVPARSAVKMTSPAFSTSERYRCSDFLNSAVWWATSRSRSADQRAISEMMITVPSTKTAMIAACSSRPRTWIAWIAPSTSLIGATTATDQSGPPSSSVTRIGA